MKENLFIYLRLKISVSSHPVDEHGNFYVLDLSKLGIQKFSSNGTFHTSWGKPATHYRTHTNNEFIPPNALNHN